MPNNTTVLRESLISFLGAALAVHVSIRFGIPILRAYHGVPDMLGWWITSGIVFTILLWRALTNSRNLQLRSLARNDLLWLVGAFVAIGMGTGIVIFLCRAFFDLDLLAPDPATAFLRSEPLTVDQYWVFAPWLLYFSINIFGEELLWRGHLLSLQTKVFGDRAWILNAILWGFIHLAISWRIAILLIPFQFVLPYVVHKTRNTWLGVIIHGVINAGAFLGMALGLAS